VDKSGNEELNVIVTQMIAASGDYIDWAKKQTLPLEGANKYFEDDPFANSTAIATEDVSKMSNHETGKFFDVAALLLSDLSEQFDF
jgi:hypothetical protein